MRNCRTLEREGVKYDGMWCYVCSTLFFYEDMLRKHLSIHDVGRIFNHNFGNADEKAGSKLDLKCYQCSTVFNTKPELIRHIESVHYKEYVDCTDCDGTFSRKDSYESHKKLQHSKSSNPVKTWKCLKCGEIFTMKKNLTRHEREVCPLLRLMQRSMVWDVTFVKQLLVMRPKKVLILKNLLDF